MSNRKSTFDMTHHFIEHLQVRYDSIIAFPMSLQVLEHGTNRKQLTISDLLERFKSNSTGEVQKSNYNGLVSSAVARRIAKKVDLLLQISPYQTVYNPITSSSQRFQLVFITLTIPFQSDEVDHRKIMKDCMRPMLAFLKLKNGVQDYVWKAELQKNGMIHYHIVTNRFIDYTKLRNKWNSLLKSAGLLSRFESEQGHSHPNSTDIHAAKSSRQVRSYVRKYLGKSDDDSRPINGKVWDCSMNLKKSKQYTSELTSHTGYELLRKMELGEIKAIRSEFSTVFLIAPHLINEYLTHQQREEYKNHIQQIKDFKMTTKPTPHTKTTTSKTTQSNRLSEAMKSPSQLSLDLKLSMYAGSQTGSSRGKGQ